MTNQSRQMLKNRILEHYGEPKDLDDLARCCIAMCGTYDNVKQPRDRRRKRLPPEYLKVVGFSWRIKYGVVSNYIDQPIDGSAYNPHNPEMYTGWNGRVWIRYATPCVGFNSEPMKLTLTYTGTGGAGAYDGPWARIASVEYYNRTKGLGLDIPRPEISSWDYRFFASDWPLIQHDFEKQVAWSELSGTPAPALDHHFEWNDPEFAARDVENIRAFEYHQFMNKDKFKHA